MEGGVLVHYDTVLPQQLKERKECDDDLALRRVLGKERDERDLALAPRVITFPDMQYAALIEVKYIKKDENVTDAAKASLLAEAKTQLERYAADHNLAEAWHLKPAGTVTLIRLAIVFQGEELLFALEI